MAPDHGVMRDVARVLRWGVAAGAFVAVVAMAPGTPLLGAAKHSVEFTIVSGKLPNVRGLDFNGYQRGAMTVTIPLGWQVVVDYENIDAHAHSFAVQGSGAHQQMDLPETPAFPGAMTAHFVDGLPKGSKQTVTFEVSKAGTYEFVCGVHGHAISGQWDTLVVSATADAPSVTPAGAVTFSVK